MTENRPEVVIVGIGQTPVGEHWETSLRELAVKAVQAARVDAGGLRPEVLYVGNMLAASASHQANLGALISEYSGMVGIEGVTVEAAEASGGAALRLAYTAILSGMVDVAMAVGVEKYTDVVGPDLDAFISQMLDADYEAAEGLTPISQAGLLMQRYIHAYQPTREALAGFPMIAHANGVNNPNAMFRKTIKADTYLNAALSSDPFNMFDIAPYADGSAAVILTRADKLPKNLPNPPVCISGASIMIDRLALHDREDPLFWSAAAHSVESACAQAGVSPDAMDFFEYSDITTLHAILSLEAAGFANRGEGWRLGLDGSLALKGKLPVATMGGYKARGHALGATGVYQAVEAVTQL
ncbi:MAG: thiolase domain-containing protein, partial [Anaerolineaceae bacterium]|nr:thiolase domain-containing protein [Anaerolineaceae bacterium]